jgi:small subunit ribosomal protein S16
MLKIRLSRIGKKGSPFYRIVVIDKQRKREGKPREILGFWDPIKKNLNINKGELESWLKKGAVVNESVKRLLEKQ